MGQLPNFTFIIPCFNVGRYLPNSIDSILNQNYKNVDIYLMDDCSSDNTLEICQEYAEKYSFIHILTNTTNVGGAEIRNIVLRHLSDDPTERWICFLDSDDAIRSKSLHALANVIGQYGNDIDFVLTGIQYIYPDYQIDEFPDMKEGIFCASELAKMVGAGLPWSIMSCSGNKIYKHSFLKKYSLFFEKKYAFNEDGGFAVNAFMNVKNVFYLKNSFYLYYQRSGSTMHSYRNNCYPTINNVISKLEIYLNSYGLNKEKIISDKRLKLAYSALFNEVYYNQYERFDQLFAFLSRDPEVRDNCRFILKSSETPFKDKVMAFLLLCRLKKIVLLRFKQTAKKTSKEKLF